MYTCHVCLGELTSWTVAVFPPRRQKPKVQGVRADDRLLRVRPPRPQDGARHTQSRRLSSPDRVRARSLSLAHRPCLRWGLRRMRHALMRHVLGAPRGTCTSRPRSAGGCTRTSLAGPGRAPAELVPSAPAQQGPAITRTPAACQRKLQRQPRRQGNWCGQRVTEGGTQQPACPRRLFTCADFQARHDSDRSAVQPACFAKGLNAGQRGTVAPDLAEGIGGCRQASRTLHKSQQAAFQRAF